MLLSPIGVWHWLSVPNPLSDVFAFRFSGIVGPGKIRPQMGKQTLRRIRGVRVVTVWRENHEIDKFAASNDETLMPMLTARYRGAYLSGNELYHRYRSCCFIGMAEGGSSTGTPHGYFFSFNWYLWGLIWPVIPRISDQSGAKLSIRARVFSIIDSDTRS